MVKCFVVGCFTGYKSAKEKYAKVFKPPKEERQFILWGKKMKRSNDQVYHAPNYYSPL
jgi:hypothetical protein